MNIFIDAVSSNGAIIFFDEARNILAREDISLQRKESKDLLMKLYDFMKSNELTFSDVQNIFCVHGPGSFTGIRTITLIVNTIAFVYPHIAITGVSFFELFSDYPILKSSSKRDVFVRKTEDSKVEILTNDEIKKYLFDNKIPHFVGDVEKDIFSNFSIDMSPKYDIIIKIKKVSGESRLTPLYIKKPNIS